MHDNPITVVDHKGEPVSAGQFLFKLANIVLLIFAFSTFTIALIATLFGADTPLFLGALSGLVILLHPYSPFRIVRNRTLWPLLMHTRFGP